MRSMNPAYAFLLAVPLYLACGESTPTDSTPTAEPATDAMVSGDSVAQDAVEQDNVAAVSYTHLRAHET